MDLEFGNYLLKRGDRLLIGPQGRIALSARSFDILVILLERPNDVVSKAELFDVAWPGLVVEENTLQVHISALRKQLSGDLIATVHGRGYKYVGPRPTIAAVAETTLSKPSLVILPFENLGGDLEQDHLADGMTEDIIAELGKFKEFLIIARNSAFQFRGKGKDPAQIAKKLGVQYVVAGSVRRLGNRLRVTVELTDAATMAHVWGEHYDRELGHIFDVQDEITHMIAARLARQTRTAVTARARARPTTSMSAYETFLRARQLVAIYGTAHDAEPLLRQAIMLDPNFSAAHALLSLVGTLKFYWVYYDPSILRSGLETAKTALKIDPDDVYGHLASGFAFLYLREFRQAEISLDRAMALNPNDPLILSIFALLHNYTGRVDQALVEISEAERRDPYAVGWYHDFRGIILTTAGRYRQAIECYAKIEDVPPWSLVRLVVCYYELGEIHDAKKALSRLRDHWPGLSIDEIVGTEVDFYEDPEICRGYRAVLRRVANHVVLAP